MKFEAIHKRFFNCDFGAFSEVTERENYDSQVTVTRDEKRIIIDYFGEENILRGSKSLNPKLAAKEFFLYPNMQPITLNLVFPKPSKTELRLYLSEENDFKPKGGDLWFVYINTDKKLVIGSLDKTGWKSISSGIIPSKPPEQLDLEFSRQSQKSTKAFFKSRARLLPQLGDMLIKSEELAFLELIKNAYDADASEVVVLMENIEDKSSGIILIEDNGFGMNQDIIENVWLELGSDFKSKKVSSIITTPKGRLPIGEKGIGRLGAHKLGNVIHVISKKKGEKEVSVKIDWRDFDKEEYLQDVPVIINESDKPTYFTKKKHGTYISISDLKTDWTRGKVRNIQRSVTSITSPFEESNEHFNPSLHILDKPQWLAGLITWKEIRDFSLFSFEIKINKGEIKQFKYEYKPLSVFDNVSQRKVSFSHDSNFSDLSNDQKLVLSNKSLKKPIEEIELLDDIGEILIKGEIFDFDSFIIKDISDKSSLKKYVQENSGVKVYRGDEDNGYVRVYDYGEPGNDWLGLNLRRVNVPVSLSNNLIVSGVFLDREKSIALREKTNREGFIEDDVFDYFRESVLHCLTVVDIFRKADKKRLRAIYGPKRKEEPVHSSINKLKDLVELKVSDDELKSTINSYLGDIESSYNTVYENLLKTASAGLGLGIVLHEIEKVIAELIHLVSEDNDHKVFGNLVRRLSRLVKGYSEIFSKTSRTDVNLKSVIDDALFSVDFRLRAHKVEVEKAYLGSKDDSVKIAKGLIEGVLINLVDNSLYWLDIALNEHKIIHNKKIFIDIIDREKYTDIIFADNGTGFLIPTEQAITPMETTKTSGGWGLGLHIANEVLLSHNGKVDFPEWSEIGIPRDYKAGAIVRLSLPK